MTHDQSFPWRGHGCRMAVPRPGELERKGACSVSGPGGAVTGGDSKPVFVAPAEAPTRM
ncbi:short-chain dehydrogenase/reductase SDR family protein [Streptomyces lydicamycinicus]|uniref:Short-chain dehydrogenase/reductase SDR family protein n=1 Tax=Streptomyces lydicamycinicus TaxID=1546107 RepID=A0A0P4RFV6_9ACTN|nr:short-chain dehydrogenase/reductase SDR family protein [Streptomyces lydicamycinicus]